MNMMPTSQTSLVLGGSHIIMWGGSSRDRASQVISKTSWVVEVFRENW